MQCSVSVALSPLQRQPYFAWVVHYCLNFQAKLKRPIDIGSDHSLKHVINASGKQLGTHSHSFSFFFNRLTK